MGMKRIEIKTGEVYGNLTVISECVPRIYSGYPHRVFMCQCKCGETKEILLSKIRTGHTISCGCYKKEVFIKHHHTHNMSNTKFYRLWNGMKNRCYLKSDKDYKNYGSRGISVCEEWRKDILSFYNWAIDNGYKNGLSIDRIDNNGSYEPNNCRWITNAEQSHNKRNNVNIKIDGITKCLSEWCRIFNVSRSTATNRLHNGYDINKVFNI